MHEAAQASAESSGLVAEAVGGSRFRKEKPMTVTNTAARNRKVSVLAALGTMLALLSSPPVHAEFDSFRPFLPLQVSTAPANGDLNPYGLVFVPAVFPSGGVLKPGQMLVSNFNGTSLQGRGSTLTLSRTSSSSRPRRTTRSSRSGAPEELTRTSEREPSSIRTPPICTAPSA